MCLAWLGYHTDTLPADLRGAKKADKTAPQTATRDALAPHLCQGRALG